MKFRDGVWFVRLGLTGLIIPVKIKGFLFIIIIALSFYGLVRCIDLASKAHHYNVSFLCAVGIIFLGYVYIIVTITKSDRL